MDDKQYWEKFYAQQNTILTPSPFAEYVLKNHLRPGIKMIELGCGNGRDALYFAHHQIDVLAVDQCEYEIDFLKQLNQDIRILFRADDFTRLPDLGAFDAVYSRFTLHSVTEEAEDRVMAWVYKSLNAGGKFLIEVRGQLNEIYRLGAPVPGEPDAFVYEDHYRRFLNHEKTNERLRQHGFRIAYSEETTGFAPFKGADDTFMRIIAEK